MSPSPPPYMPRIEESHWKSIQALPHRAQRESALKFIKEYLPYTPKTLMPNGKLKELRGEHKGMWQFDIDRDYRILYTIDEDAREVIIEYVGYHPDWRRSRGGRRIRR